MLFAFVRHLASHGVPIFANLSSTAGMWKLSLLNFVFSTITWCLKGT